MKITFLSKLAIATVLGFPACGSEEAMPGGEFVIKDVTPQSVPTQASENSLSPELDGSSAGNPLMQPAAYTCDVCEGNQPFKGDGVKIHSCASAGCSVVGLGYRSQRYATICKDLPIPHYKNGFGHILNRATGVAGWCKDPEYVEVACN